MNSSIPVQNYLYENTSLNLKQDAFGLNYATVPITNALIQYLI